MHTPPFHIVLLNPEIPNNTGNIGRTAVATGCVLHLIHPLGFSLDEKARRRAGLDYWIHLDCREHESWEDFLETESPRRLWLFTTASERPQWKADFSTGTTCSSDEKRAVLLMPFMKQSYNAGGQSTELRSPCVPKRASLNLATAVLRWRLRRVTTAR